MVVVDETVVVGLFLFGYLVHQPGQPFAIALFHGFSDFDFVNLDGGILVIAVATCGQALTVLVIEEVVVGAFHEFVLGRHFGPIGLADFFEPVHLCLSRLFQRVMHR